MGKVEGEKQYWVRTEQGRTWGPYTVDALERLRGQLTDRCEVALDGKTFRSSAEFPELALLLVPGRAEAVRERPPPPARISSVLRAAFGDVQTALAQAPAPDQDPRARMKAATEARARQGAGATPVATAPVAAAPTPLPPPPPEIPTELPEEGELERVSPVRLYALAALTSASGWLQLQGEAGHMLQISFRRGTPEHLDSDDPDLSLVRFLVKRGTINGAQGLQAEEHAQHSGVDVVSALFQLQLIPPAEAHRLLGEHALFLLDRALTSWRGRFSFEREAPSPPGAFPLGQRWTLLAEAIRRIEPAPIRARLGKRLLRPVLRSGGLGIGRVEELALNAQEARLYAAIDGVRTGEELLRAQDAAVTVRLLYLLAELGHLSFGEDEAPQTQPQAGTAAAPGAAEPAAPGAIPPAAEAHAAEAHAAEAHAAEAHAAEAHAAEAHAAGPHAAAEAKPGASKLPPRAPRSAEPPPWAPPVMGVAHAASGPGSQAGSAMRPPVLTPGQVSPVPAAPRQPTADTVRHATTPGAPASAPPPRPPPAPARAPATPVRPPPAPVARPAPSMPPAAAASAGPSIAAGPAGEAEDVKLQRLQALLAKLEKGTHFQALGIERKATAPEVKKAFFVLARELHPDTVTDPAQSELRSLKERLFARVNEAAQVLGEEQRRKEYEAEIDGKAGSVDVARIFAAEESFQRAEIMIKARRYKEGLDLLDEAIKLNDAEAEFYAWRGYARFLLSKERKTQYPESVADCKKALKMVERCLPAHLFLGNMAKVMGELKQAEQSFRKVLELDPKHVEAQRELRMMGAGKK